MSEFNPLQRTRESIEAIAAERGLICIFPEDDELTLDIDRKFSSKTPRINERVLEVLQSNGVKVKSILYTKSVSGNVHVWIRYDNKGIFVSNAERIALQTALGSDPVREALSLLRFQAGSTAPIAMFETETEAEKVENWRKQ